MSRRWSIPERWPYERMLVGAGAFAFGTSVIAILSWGLAPIWAHGAAVGVSAAMLVLGLLATVRRQRRLHSLIECDWKRCPYCFFDLRGLNDHGICPECGEPYIVREVRERWKDLTASEAEEEKGDEE